MTQKEKVVYFLMMAALVLVISSGVFVLIYVLVGESVWYVILSFLTGYLTVDFLTRIIKKLEDK